MRRTEQLFGIIWGLGFLGLNKCLELAWGALSVRFPCSLDALITCFDFPALLWLKHEEIDFYVWRQNGEFSLVWNRLVWFDVGLVWFDFGLVWFGIGLVWFGIGLVWFGSIWFGIRVGMLKCLVSILGLH